MHRLLASVFDTSSLVFDLRPIQQAEAQHTVVPRVCMHPLWLGANTLLVQSLFANGAFHRAFRIDLKHKRFQSQTRLSQVINNFRGDWSISADKRWVLWREGWLENTYQFTATTPDGSRSVRWTVHAPDEVNCAFSWLPNSSQWIHLHRDSATGKIVRAFLYDVAHPRWQKQVPVPALNETLLLGVQAEGSLLLSDSPSDSDRGGYHPIHIAFMSFRNNVAQRRLLRIARPIPGVLAGLYPSPDGKHLAWLFHQGRVRFAGDSYDSPHQAVLYTTTIQGKNPRPIGVIAFVCESDAWRTVLHGWFPDSKRLLLEYQSQLFEVLLKG